MSLDNYPTLTCRIITLISIQQVILIGSSNKRTVVCFYVFSASFLTRLFSKVLKVENENVYNLQFESSEDLRIICTCTLHDVHVEIRMNRNISSFLWTLR